MASVLALVAGVGAGSYARAADVRVLCAANLRSPLVALARTFARSSGHRVDFVFASAAAVHKQVASGAQTDVAIGTATGVDALVRLGRGIEGSSTPLVRTALALALPLGASPIDPRDAGAVADALRDAVSIVQPDPSLGVSGGAQAAAFVAALGMREELRARTRLVADAREVSKRIAAGSASLGIGAMHDLVTRSEVLVIGPLPADGENTLAYAAVLVGSANSDPARAFVAHLRSAQAAAIFIAAGYVPIE